MQKIKQLYRSNYTGEGIIRDLVWEDGEWKRTVEYVPNVVENKQISGKAVVLGNGISRTMLYPQGNLFQLLNNHKGGLLAAGRVQTYGCNAIVRDYMPDFVCANDEMAAEIVEKGYWYNNIIYGTNAMVLGYPGKFYMVPQAPNWDMGATAAYLACFDGHKTVYLMGFDLHTGDTNYQHNVYSGTRGYPAIESLTTETYFENTMLRVMKLYNDVDFVRVMPTKEYYMPESWKYQLNLRQITFDEFVREVDL
jgi:hypothetical protein